MLEVKDLAVSYGRHRALEGVGLTVGKGEICVILGANGAGKSTLLKTIAGMVKADSGEVAMNGRAITRLKPHRIVEEGIALVPEGRGIFGDLTVAENLQLGAFARRARHDEAATLKDIYELFPRLAERKRQIARTMSGGEQQMVAIGRALMSKPDILMLDEPSLGLSPILTQELFRSLTAVAATGVGILLVEQNAKQSLKIAKRGYLIENGHVTGENSAERLRNDPAVIAAYLGGAAGGRHAKPKVQLPPSMPLPGAVAAMGRVAGDLAARAGQISRAFVRALRGAEAPPSAFVGRYDPIAGGDPWREVAGSSSIAADGGHASPAIRSVPPVAEDARWLAAASANLASRAGDRLARHVAERRRAAEVPSAFQRARWGGGAAEAVSEATAASVTSVSSSVAGSGDASERIARPDALSPADLAGRAADRFARHLAEARKAAPLPSAFRRPPWEIATTARSSVKARVDARPANARKLNGSHGLIGHNSAGADIEPDAQEMTEAPAASVSVAPSSAGVPPSPAGVSIADLVARAAEVQKRHVDEARKSLTAFTVPVSASRPESSSPDTPPPPPSAVPLPRFAGEDLASRTAASLILPRSRGRGTTRSVVEGAQATTDETPVIADDVPKPKAGKRAAAKKKSARKGKKHKAKKSPARHEEKR